MTIITWRYISRVIFEDDVKRVLAKISYIYNKKVLSMAQKTFCVIKYWPKQRWSFDFKICYFVQEKFMK